jgi:hypothetical protein
MSAIYEAIGRLVVDAVRRRYAAQLRTAALIGAGLAALAVAGYVATRGDGGDDG